MGQYCTAKMLMLVLWHNIVDKWLLSAAIYRLGHNSLQVSAIISLKCVICS